jgi:MurNAc alpha-1-phosphate uridylyltransferase
MKAMLLSAGRGSRMQTLTDECPKPLLRINNKPLIQHHIEQLSACGISEFVINLHYLGDQIQAWLGDGAEFNVSICYSYETQLLGMGGGVRHALSLLGEEPFLVMSNDVLTDYDFKKLINKNVVAAHLVLVNNPDFHPEGDYSLAENNVTEKNERTYNYAGFGVFSPELFKPFEKNTAFGIKPVLKQHIKQQKVTGEYFNGYWLNLNTPHDLQQAQQDYA